jgi:hypothetical protein
MPQRPASTFKVSPVSMSPLPPALPIRLPPGFAQQFAEEGRMSVSVSALDFSFLIRECVVYVGCNE